MAESHVLDSSNDSSIQSFLAGIEEVQALKHKEYKKIPICGE